MPCRSAAFITERMITITLGQGYTSPVTFTLSDVPDGLNSVFSVNPLPPASQSVLTLTTVSTVAQRYHYITLNANNGAYTRKSYLVLNTIP